MSKLSFQAFYLVVAIAFASAEVLAQDTSNYKKYYLYTGAVYAGSMLALNQLWYADHERTSFHTFNDNSEWLKIDKAGHIYSAYALSSIGYQFLKGNKKFDRKAANVSAATAFVFLSSIELLDGFSKRWGYSWGDMISNTLGIGLFYGQEALFQKQILRLKYSYLPSKYRELRPELLGDNELQGIFKDYNGQTYWASINLNSFSDRIKPKWLNLAFGYTGEGMVSARKNRMDEIQGFRHERAYLLGFDFDLSKIEVSKRWLKTLLKVVNHIKVPSPTLEFEEKGSTKFHWLYF